MKARIVEQLERCGAEVCAEDEIVFEGGSLELRVHASGTLELSLIHSARLHTQGLLDALRNNPEVGWSWVVSARGELVRRLVLSPIVWVHGTTLRENLVALVHGMASAESAPAILEIMPLLPERCPLEPAVIGGVALWLLRRDGVGLGSVRHVLANRGDDVWCAAVAGSSRAELRAWATAEREVLEAFIERPQAARLVAEKYAVQQGE